MVEFVNITSESGICHDRFDVDTACYRSFAHLNFFMHARPFLTVNVHSSQMTQFPRRAQLTRNWFQKHSVGFRNFSGPRVSQIQPPIGNVANVTEFLELTFNNHNLAMDSPGRYVYFNIGAKIQVEDFISRRRASVSQAKGVARYYYIAVYIYSTSEWRKSFCPNRNLFKIV